MSNKLNYVFNLINDNNLDIVSITETWLTLDCDTSFVDLPGFSFYRGDTAGTVRKHGAGLYVSDSVSSCLIETAISNVVVVFLSDLGIFVASVYRPPSYDANENNNLVEFLRNFSVGREVVIMGDFNLPSISWDHSGGFSSLYSTPTDRLFRECFAGCGLTQWVKGATFFPSGNTLDLVLTSEEDRVLEVESAPPLPGCHHCPVIIQLIFQFSSPDVEECEGLSWSRGNYDVMSDELFGVDWENIFDGLNSAECYQLLCTKLMELVLEHVPKRTPNKKPSWLSRPPGSLRRRRKRAWENFKQLRRSLGANHADVLESFRKYAEVNRVYKNYSRSHQCEYEIKLADLLSVAPKAFHSYIRSKKKGCPSVGPLRGESGQLVNNQGEICNMLVDVFTSVYVVDEPTNVPEAVQPTYEMEPMQISYDKVLEHLWKLKASSSPGPDGIHPRILKSCALILALPLSIIFAKSLEEGIVPASWKIARVVPIFKGGSKSTPLNYRPVSMTASPCKVMERLLAEHIIKYLEDNHILRDGQFGFRQGHSVEDQLLLMYGEVVERVDAGGIVDVVYIDLSRAFEVVNHGLLLRKLRALGFSEELLKWIESFLVGRSLFVAVGSRESEVKPVRSGVPQGSVLGPLLFLIYVNSLSDGLVSKWFAYADDYKLYCSNLRGACDTLQSDLNTFSVRASSHNLQLNPNKCVFIRFGSSSTEVSYRLNGRQLTKVDSHRDLGVVVDSSLRFHLHIGGLVKKANGLANQLLRGTVCRNARFMVTLFVSHIRPLLDHASRVWNVGYLGDAQQLESVQRRWIMETLGMEGNSYTECLETLKLFSVHGRLLRGDLIKIWQVLNPTIDVGVSSLLDRQAHVATRSNGFKLAVPRCRTELRRRFWSVRCVQSWNNLPPQVVQAASLESFKRRLDKHMGNIFFRTVDEQ